MRKSAFLLVFMLCAGWAFAQEKPILPELPGLPELLALEPYPILPPLFPPLPPLPQPLPPLLPPLPPLLPSPPRIGSPYLPPPTYTGKPDHLGGWKFENNLNIFDALKLQPAPGLGWKVQSDLFSLKQYTTPKPDYVGGHVFQSIDGRERYRITPVVGFPGQLQIAGVLAAMMRSPFSGASARF
jgi:hypothetical protein